jgi:Uma2 family endonuclease
MNTKVLGPRTWTPLPNGQSPLPVPVGRPRYARDHTELPSEDPTVVKNLNEHPQAALLTITIEPVLRRRHPDGRYAVGNDSYVYFEDTDPPAAGAKAPDWFYVPDVPALLDGGFRRSYVLWRERVAPVVVIEFVSGDGTEERDQTPGTGKFWAYEQAIRAEYYAILDPFRESLEVHRLVGGRYQPVPTNGRGHHPVETLGVELGLWRGWFLNMDATWLRWWDDQGDVLPTPEELLDVQQRRAERLAEKLRELGVDPDAV